jgi:hypothetical protein
VVGHLCRPLALADLVEDAVEKVCWHVPHVD